MPESQEHTIRKIEAPFISEMVCRTGTTYRRKSIINCLIIAVVLVSANSCIYGVNKTNSGIGLINRSCNNWDSIESIHSVRHLTDSLLIKQLPDFGQQPFPNKVLYFDDPPKELIAVSEEHAQVRYVYNPKIADQVLDGLSPQLTEKEKSRILRRVDSVLSKFGCKQFN